MTEKIMTTGLTKLHAARGDVARMVNMIARTNAEQHSKLAEIAALQSDLEAIVKKSVSQHAKLAECERALGEAEQEALDQHCIELAATTIKMQASDPLRHRDRVIANVHLLRRAHRTAMDWPINKPYFVEPIILQALALLPPRDAMDTPVNELGYRGAPWEMRRRQLLAEFETEPLKAA
jgi:hypothetical protein